MRRNGLRHVVHSGLESSISRLKNICLDDFEDHSLPRSPDAVVCDGTEQLPELRVLSEECVAVAVDHLQLLSLSQLHTCDLVLIFAEVPECITRQRSVHASTTSQT